MRRMMEHRVVRIPLGLALAALLVVCVTNAVVVLGAGATADRAADVPRAQAALVLGALVRPDGTPSSMLRDRLDAATGLYRARRVRRILVSGDHGRTTYDEVNAMRRELLARGVPARDVFTDHAGFDTWDSVVRARKVFGVRSAVVVTQGFHLPRALWLARRAGLDATGLRADRLAYGSQGRRSWLREWVARTKAVADVVTGADPRFLGPRIPITGDARASAG